MCLCSVACSVERTCTLESAHGDLVINGDSIIDTWQDSSTWCPVHIPVLTTRAASTEPISAQNPSPLYPSLTQTHTHTPSTWYGISAPASCSAGLYFPPYPCLPPGPAAPCAPVGPVPPTACAAALQNKRAALSSAHVSSVIF